MPIATRSSHNCVVCVLGNPVRLATVRKIPCFERFSLAFTYHSAVYQLDLT